MGEAKKDERIVQRERDFIVNGALSNFRYRDELLKAGGAEREDVAYLDAYDALIEIDSQLARVVAEVYFARTSSYVEKLEDEKDCAIEGEDFERASLLQERKYSFCESVSSGLDIMLNSVADKIAELGSGLEE